MGINFFTPVLLHLAYQIPILFVLGGTLIMLVMRKKTVSSSLYYMTLIGLGALVMLQIVGALMPALTMMLHQNNNIDYRTIGKLSSVISIILTLLRAISYGLLGYVLIKTISKRAE